MPEVLLNIPQIGEGIQEARVVALLKQPGDKVTRDEVIYQMETDKAVMDVESPYSGTVVKWLAQVDDVLPVGKEVMVMDSEDGSRDSASSASAPQKEELTESAPGEVVVQIPAIGEGLQEARIVAKLKNEGDSVKKDEIIYQMETDKAVMDVESPYSGKIGKWLAEVDQVVPIGGDVLTMITNEAPATNIPQATSTPATTPPTPTTSSAPPMPGGERRKDLPPRTRAYAKEKGLTADQIASIPSTGKKLMPADIDAFLTGGSTPSSSVSVSTSGKEFEERKMPSAQRILSSRLSRGSQLVVPGMMSLVANWGPLEALRAEVKESGADFSPSTFTYFAYCVAKAAVEHPIMRSTLVGDDTIRTYKNLQLGIAVTRPGDELAVAVVRDADTLDFRTFAEQARANIISARDGEDQADESVTLSITNMQAYEIRDAMAVVVPPGVSTIFLGEAYNGLAPDVQELKYQRCANIGITIDHRIVNGVGGAEFLQAIKLNVENIREIAKL